MNATANASRIGTTLYPYASAMMPATGDLDVIRRAAGWLWSVVSKPVRAAIDAVRQDVAERRMVEERRAAALASSAPSGLARTEDLERQAVESAAAGSVTVETTRYPALVVVAYADRETATWETGDVVDPAPVQVAADFGSAEVAPKRRRNRKASETDVTTAANAPVRQRIGRYRVVGSGTVGLAYNGASERQARPAYAALADSGEVIHLYRGSDLIERQ